MKPPKRRPRVSAKQRDPQEQAERTIARFGWMVQAVMSQPPWYYTIGLTRFELPEVMLVGNFAPVFAANTLNHIGHLMHSREHTFDDGTICPDLFEDVKVLFREISPSEIERWCGRLLEFCGTSARVLHVLLPDKHGVMPWETQSKMATQLNLKLTYKSERPLSLYVN